MRNIIGSFGFSLCMCLPVFTFAQTDTTAYVIKKLETEVKTLVKIEHGYLQFLDSMYTVYASIYNINKPPTPTKTKEQIDVEMLQFLRDKAAVLRDDLKNIVKLIDELNTGIEELKVKKE